MKGKDKHEMLTELGNNLKYFFSGEFIQDAQSVHKNSNFNKVLDCNRNF